LKRTLRVAVLALGIVFTRAPVGGDEAVAAGKHDATSHHTFEDVEHWVSVFDDPRRDEWQKPAEVVAALKLAPGSMVADLGAGTGYFSRYLAQAVGERGTVLAADVEPQLVEHIRKRAEREKTTNVVPVLASADNPRLPYGRVDVVLIVDTYHHFNDRIAYLRRLAQALAAGGRIAVIDWFKRELPEGPPMDHKLAREQIVGELSAAGYELVEEPTFLPYQYFLVFKLRIVAGRR
jgi:ubiquinone/menaquinone biosynthesis C-methylase UbiE